MTATTGIVDTIPPIRPELRGKTPYGAPQIDVPIQLNTNENPHHLSSGLVDDIVAAVRDIAANLNRYPDRDAVALRADLANYLTRTVAPIEPGQVWAANGSNEVLDQLMRAFAGSDRKVLGFEPSYSMHRTIAEASGARYVSVARDGQLEIDRNTALAAIRSENPDIVIVCSPNNPTGGSTDPRLIAEIYDAAPGMVLVDEAYAEFSAQQSALALLKGRPRMVVSRTMSKAFGFAGARLGYLAADPRIVDALLLVRLPYHLSSVTQAVSRAALAHADELLATVHDVAIQRDRIVDQLQAMGLEVVPSDANFVLFRAPGRDASSLWSRLLEDGVLIRDPGIKGYLRVTAGTAGETTRFLTALKEAL